MSICTYTISYHEIIKGCVKRKAKKYHECKYCPETIRTNDTFYDRGFGRRICQKCYNKFTGKS